MQEAYQPHRLANRKGLSRKHIFDSVKSSLERLQTGYIDVLQCHRFDPDTPIEETMEALHDVVKAGWVRYIGMSSCDAWQFHAMQSKSRPTVPRCSSHSLQTTH
jgi:aryl-alcohol dehydrogenase-like predicted oxidoreductase